MTHVSKTLILVALSITFSCSNNEKDSVKQAHEQNLNSAIDEDISKYMTETADSRMMAIEEGKLARTKATKGSVKGYAEQLVNSNTKILHDLRVLAASKNIVLPNFLSNRNTRALDQLRNETGEDFDDAFLKLMRKSYKRDLGAFDDATDFKDQDIQKFAENRIPLLKSQLESIEQLESHGENVSSRSNNEEDN